MKKFILLILLALGLVACTTTGMRVVATSSTYTNIGDINWDEYKIPVMSIYIGPKTTVWVNKDFHDVRVVDIFGSVTNDTSALGVYSSKELKNIHLHLVLNGTNSVVKAAQ